MAGLRVGTVGGEPTVRVARPGLGTGAVILGGGDCQRWLPSRANHVPTKSCANTSNYCRALFLFLQAKHFKQAQTDLLSTGRGTFCKLRGSAPRQLEYSHTASHPWDTRAGASRGCNRRNALPAQRSSFKISSRRARPSSSIRSLSDSNFVVGSLSSRLEATNSREPLSYPQANFRRLVESASSVCYFLMARGVAQLGSAPALGAGGRPFKSARPDRASSSGG